ncbi:hypothetical protein KQ313_00630 [Synechococcus sp. CS-1325]|uniref:hypothetical protein n=1 Tax=unclassified Synechococcus TaxID=2626047 RepID=UPI0021A79B5C|nr:MULTISPECIES: hypothetical protein [unclassified Synechococcus]MCT0198198.1 hypothetical protein [Synechococcus sp. CS-1325]MCT0213717.1 hypothetical protein [Synechococcus sp. CS-1326]MCT0234064.1 hypothetical protein [Synechococcus sp. CS-1327]
MSEQSIPGCQAESTDSDIICRSKISKPNSLPAGQYAAITEAIKRLRLKRWMPLIERCEQG